MNNNHTIFENLSQNQLTALFSADNWGALSFSERMNACQEVENRYAAENNVEPCTVRHQPMKDACYGWQSGQTICLNTYLVRDGQFCTYTTDQNGNTQEIRIAALAPGWNTLDTVYHEGTHGIQESTGRAPYTYIPSDMDGDLYRIQAIEKEAYVMGQLRTLDALSNYEKEVGHLDASRTEYFDSVKADSYQAALADAARNYNDPNIEQTLKDFINDRENNITRENPNESYQAISKLYDTFEMSTSADRSQLETSTGANSQITNPDISVSPGALTSNDENTQNSRENTDDIVQNDSMNNATSENTEASEKNNFLTTEDGFKTSFSSSSASVEADISDGMDTEIISTATEHFDDGYSNYESNSGTEDSSVETTQDDGYDFGSGTENGSSSEPNNGSGASASDDMSYSD